MLGKRTCQHIPSKLDVDALKVRSPRRHTGDQGKKERSRDHRRGGARRRRPLRVQEAGYVLQMRLVSQRVVNS